MGLDNIKNKVIKILIIAGKAILSFIYFFMKLRPIKNDKVLFLSRQSDTLPLDFLLLKNELKILRPEVYSVFIGDHIRPGFAGYLHFGVSMIKSMWNLAGAKVCVIDSYWPAVCMFKHKSSLKVIQMWHSIGKMKKSGYQALGKKSGRNADLAYLLNMHRNYDYVIGGAKFWNRFYAEAFDISESKILNCGLPRIDYLIDTKDINRKKFFEEFPEYAEKKLVLYAPTFRKNMESKWHDILDAEKYDDIIIMIKNHPEQWVEEKQDNRHILYLPKYKTVDLIAVCDYLITDYSSIALEAAVLKKKTFFWTYDYDEYMKNSGTNIDLKSEVAANMSADINKILYCVENDIYDTDTQQRYINKFLPHELGGSTEKIAKLVIELMDE